MMDGWMERDGLRGYGSPAYVRLEITYGRSANFCPSRIVRQ